MKTFTGKRRYIKVMLLVWSVSLLSAVAGYMVILAPQFGNRKKIEKKVAEQRKSYEEALNASKQETRNAAIERNEALREKLNTFVVDYDNISNLTFVISRIAQDKNLPSLNVVQKSGEVISDKSNTKKITERRIGVGFSTGFHQFITFVNALERNKPVMFIDRFSLNMSGQDNSGYEVNMDIAALVERQQISKTVVKEIH